MGIRYYGRNNNYDGPPLTKLIDFLDACKVPIFTFSYILIMGIMGDSLFMLGIGTLGLSLFTLAYLLVLLFRRPA